MSNKSFEQISLFSTQTDNNPLQEIVDYFDKAIKVYSSRQYAYGVWDHVPNLGERLSIYYHNVPKESEIDYGKIEILEHRYNCEISVIAQPDFKDKDKCTVYVFTIYRKYLRKGKND